MKKTVTTSLYAISVLMMAIVFNVMANESPATTDPPKKTMKNGWAEINQYRTDLQNSDLSEKKINKKANKDLVGKTVRFSGYMKLIKPHFAENYDYFFAKESNETCLPIIKSKAYCGKDNPDYFRVIFNGSAASKRDMMIMENPHDNKFISQKGSLSTTKIQEGNYEVSIYDQSYNVDAKIKEVYFKCLNQDCSENAMTIHIDHWKYTKLP